MKLDSINFLKDATKVENIDKGYSGAIKYSFEKNNKRYFLKIGKFEVNTELENLLTEANIYHPCIIEFGKFNDEYNYVIEEYVEGKNLKEELNKYDSKYIYEYGFKIGEQYRNLRKVYFDKPMEEGTIEKILLSVNKKIKTLQDLIYGNSELNKEEIKFINYIIEYLQNKTYLIKNSSLIYGHTDIKPSNYLIFNRNIIATDIENTSYKELSLSMKWTFARTDYNDEKNLAFARGYLDGLFNLDIPKNILECFDYTYLFCAIDHLTRYIERGSIDKVKKFIHHINKNYMVKNEIKISENLKGYININNFPELKGYDITLMKGSHNPNNLTFKCANSNSNYFLKIMRMTDASFLKSINCYKLLEECNIPISHLKFYGMCEYDKYYYIISEFIKYPEMNKGNEIATFEEGFKYGKIVAQYFKKLKKHTCEGASVFAKENLYNDIMNCVKFVYKDNEYCDYIIWSKEELISYIDNYIKSFDDEPINLIHGDVKFGNILYDGKKEFYFVDNENLVYSYDIMNFLYNIHIGFLEKNDISYRGFINGYLKYMNNGKISFKIHNQAKLLLIYYVLRITRNILNEKGNKDTLQYVLDSCKKYIGKDNEIEWLK